MKRFRWCLILSCIATTIGCGSPPLPDQATQAHAKVDAFKKLADAMAKDATGVEAKSALEEFRNCFLDVNKNTKEAEEILEIYRQRIKGKAQGEVAQEVQMEMTPIETALKKAKK